MGRSNQGSRISYWVEEDMYTVGQEVGEDICIVDQAQDSRTVSMCILTDLPADTICLEHNRHMQHLNSHFFDVSSQFFHIYQF